jgi:alanine racemase
MHRVKWIEIDLDAVRHNFKSIREKVGNGIKILAVVKADAYGHGAVEVSKILSKNGVDMFGIADPEEGIELRENNINVPILLLNPILPEQTEEVLRYSLGITVYNLNTAKKISEIAKRSHYKTRVHVEVDTGMGGTGVHPDKVLSFIKSLLVIKNLTIEGIFTHFHSCDEKDKSFTHEQTKIFKKTLKQLGEEKIHIPLIHAANSAAILDIPDSYFNMVRPGLILYGIFPSSYVSKNINLKPVMSLKARIINLKHLDSGSTVSYGRTFKISKSTSVATIPVGYKDGFSRCFSNLGNVLVNGIRTPIIGRVCMDRCFIDVTNVPNVNIGSEVVLYGKQKNEAISIESSVELIDTIPYEIVCNIGRKVPKIYKK